MSTGVAFAEHWSGPYTRQTHAMDVSGGCEDAAIYQSSGSGIYHLIFHCGCDYQTLWSTDGYNWKRTTKPQPFCNVTFSDGSSLPLSTRQRPKWVVAKNGSLTHLFTGAAGAGIHMGQTFTLAQQLL